MDNNGTDKIFLKYADIISKVNDANEDLAKLCLKQRVTAGRDFRRTLRELRDDITAVIKLSQATEKEIRKDKKETKQDA